MNAKGKPRSAKSLDIDDGLTQSERFIKAAQELGTDDDPERFAERIKKLSIRSKVNSEIKDRKGNS